MITATILFLVPTILFVAAFLYETLLSFKRLGAKARNRANYLSATWEVTHTLLVFAVVMLIMLFTQDLAGLSAAIFTSTFLAASALGVRAAAYIYIFYARQSHKISWVDWVFAFSHIVAAVFLVTTVILALWYLHQHNPPVNSQFLPFFLPGLGAVLLVCAIPLFFLYKTRD